MCNLCSSVADFTSDLSFSAFRIRISKEESVNIRKSHTTHIFTFTNSQLCTSPNDNCSTMKSTNMKIYTYIHNNHVFNFIPADQIFKYYIFNKKIPRTNHDRRNTVNRAHPRINNVTTR